MIFRTTQFQYSMDVQFKFEIFKKIQVNRINSLNILKCHEKLPNFSIEFGVLCKGCTKNLEAKIKKKNFRVNSLPSALTLGHSAKSQAEISIFLKILCRVPGQGHSAKKLKNLKKLFAECQIRGTRQRFKFKFCKRLRMKKLSTSKL